MMKQTTLTSDTTTCPTPSEALQTKPVGSGAWNIRRNFDDIGVLGAPWLNTTSGMSALLFDLTDGTLVFKEVDHAVPQGKMPTGSVLFLDNGIGSSQIEQYVERSAAFRRQMLAHHALIRGMDRETRILLNAKNPIPSNCEDGIFLKKVNFFNDLRPYLVDNWDGVGARKVASSDIELAWKILEYFPEYLGKEDAQPASDGSICIEWYSKNGKNKIFLDIGPEGRLMGYKNFPEPRDIKLTTYGDVISFLQHALADLEG